MSNSSIDGVQALVRSRIGKAADINLDPSMMADTYEQFHDHNSAGFHEELLGDDALPPELDQIIRDQVAAMGIDPDTVYGPVTDPPANIPEE